MARRRSYSLSVIGMGGAGKTRFLLKTAPRPLYVIAMDPNTKAVADDLGLGKKQGVIIKHIAPPTFAFDERDDVMAEATDKWEEFRQLLRPIVKGEQSARTVGFDTAGELYHLGILATFGKGDQIPPQARTAMMGPINSRWKGIVNALEQVGVNVILLHRGSEKWEDKIVETQRGAEETRHKMTGVFDVERASGSFGGTSFIVSTEIVLAFNENREGKLSDKFGMKIVRSQQRPGLIGTKYWGATSIDGQRIHKASYGYLSTLLYPGTTLGDWT